MRIMGIDYGDARTGVAVSDMMNFMTGDAFVIESWKPEHVAEEIAWEAKSRGVGTIVLGLPKNMNNTSGERVEKTMEFKAMLERRTGLPVHMWDERLTTVAADRTLIEAGVRRENRKEYVDMLAAVYILQGYLDSLERKKNDEEN